MSEQIMRENLFVIAQAYADAKGLALTTVSKQIHGNQNFLRRYLAGEISTQVRTYWLMVDKFRAGWPTGVKWPATRQIPRTSRVPYQEPQRARKLPKRGSAGKFLGKKVHKEGARG